MTTIQLPNDSDLPRLDPDQIQGLKGKQQPVLVVGMHNSGTSILTEILHENGIFFGANMRHYESYFFSNFINDRVILGGGGNWAKLPLLSEEEVLKFAGSVGPFIRKHWIADYLQWGYDGISPWGIKDPRLCVLLPLYLKVFPKARVVHIRRNPNDIAASLTGKFKAGVGVLNDFDHWKELTEAYTQRVLNYSDQCAFYYELQYEDLCIKPNELTKDLFNFLGLPFTPRAEKLLAKVTPERIGSYERWQESKKHPIRARLKSLLGK
jgi:hypothetical protein